ncbi:MAG: CPBP family intramembrane glutamic endopeptidase [Steroidobacteraceae bacterium]
MNGIASKTPGPRATSSVPRTLLASRRHTLIFFAICLAVTLVSALNANRGAPPGAPANSSQMLQLYLFLIGMEWLWVRFVYKGMQAHGRSLLEFFGHPWFTPRQLAGDLAYATLALGFCYALFIGIDRLPQHGEAVTNPLLPAVPSGPAGIIVWIGLSLSAGICEEIVFRGYLQRQLAALTGSTSLAILGQAIVFGIVHGYEGVNTVIRIVVCGLAFGMLAQWRGNLRAGVLAHAAWDILAGLGLA